MTWIPYRQNPVGLLLSAWVIRQTKRGLLHTGMFHDVARTRPAAAVIVSHHAAPFVVFDFDQVVPPSVARANDCATHSAVETAISLKQVMARCEPLVNVLEELRTADVSPSIWEDPCPVIVKQVPKQEIGRAHV